MSVVPLSAEDLYGLFELDLGGIVLYSRREPPQAHNKYPDMAGRNFYNDVLPFQNTEEFRKCVTQFTTGSKFAESFDFDCRYEGVCLPVRVLLARIRESVNHDGTKSVLVHLRRAEREES